jgi:hypothetical protein
MALAIEYVVVTEKSIRGHLMYKYGNCRDSQGKTSVRMIRLRAEF